MNKDYITNLSLAEKDYADALQIWFIKHTNQYLNLKKPTTFNEKIQWLKLYDSTPLKTITTDKYLVREWVKEKIGEKYLVPLLGVYDNFEDIDFNKLPNRFVIKTNHGSGWNKVVLNKNTLDINELRIKFNQWLSTNFAFMYGFELHYKDIKPKIIIEKYIQNKSGVLYDYKIWCFNGEPKYIQFRDDWKANLKMAFFDTQWNKQEFHYDHPLYEKDLPKPDNLSEMLDIAKRLCKGFMFVCVDLYRLDNGTIYFGEMTYTRSSGIANWQPAEWNKKLGEMIKLPENKEEIMKKYNYKITHEPKVSVIIPVYNVEKYLPKCLDSVINQTLKDIEIICINDESPDNSAQILEEYAKRDERIIILNQTNSGQGSARNRGLEIAKGKYIQFLDSDDYYEPNCCEEMYNLMERHKDIDVACFDTNIIYDAYEFRKNTDTYYFQMRYKGLHRNKISMLSLVDCNCWNKIFKKSFIDKNNLKFPEKLHYEDYGFFWFWMTRVKHIYFYPKKLTNYLRREGSFLGEIFEKSSQTIFDNFKIFELIYNDLNKQNIFAKYKETYIKRYINNFKWLINCFANEKYHDKRRFIDVYSDFLKQIDISDINLENWENLLISNLLNKNYYVFGAYKKYELENLNPIHSNSINIVFSTDRNYVSYLAVTIKSIIDNSSLNNNYDIVVLCSNLYEWQKRFLLSLQEKHHNISIRLFDMQHYIQKYNLDKLFTVNHISISAYFRLFVGKIFASYNKILYLDCDLITTKDVAQLFSIDIGDYPIAAVPDLIISNSILVSGYNCNTWEYFRKYMLENLGFSNLKTYFNSGVMIIDIEKFNKIEFDYLLDLTKRNNKFFHDQNVLNAAFEDNYFQLPAIWNFQWNIKFHSTNDCYKNILPSQLLALYEDYDIVPAIIHYTSHEKPWKNPHHTFANVWWEYARKSPFYEIIVKENLKNVPSVMSSVNIDYSIINDLISKPFLKLKYIKYKLLSKITFGNMKKHYKEKKKMIKSRIKKANSYFRKNYCL